VTAVRHPELWSRMEDALGGTTTWSAPDLPGRDR